MKLIATIGIGGANGHIIEYTGEIIHKMSMEERMTLCNMSIECGARAGLIAPDQKTYDYIQSRAYGPDKSKWQTAVNYWKSFASDQNSTYDKEIMINISDLNPMISWGTNPAEAIEINGKTPEITDENIENSLNYMGLKPSQAIRNIPINWAFIGSCTNGRIEDMRIAAAILKNKTVHPNVTFYIVPGSEAVLNQIKQEKLDRIFEKSGAILRMPGCSLCIAMNDDKIPPGKRCISSSNRNFMGRQGPDSRTHIASPATVTASAIAGKITGDF